MSSQEKELRLELERMADSLGRVRDRWENAPIPSFVLDPLGLVVDLNQAAATWVGRPKDHLRDRPFPAILAVAHGDFQAHLRLCQKTGTATRVELPVGAPGKGRTTVHLVTVAMANGCYQTHVTDISERRTTEAILRFLADASLRLGAFLDAAMAARTATELAVPMLADIATFDTAEDNPRRRLAHARHERRARGAVPDGPGSSWLPRVADAARHACLTRETVVIGDLTGELDDPRLPAERRSQVEALGLRACVVVPVVAREATHGILTLYQAGSGRGYGPEALELIREVARRINSAFTNIVLHDEVVALSAARDEFLAHVSHELREPLTSLRTWARVARLRASDPVALGEALRIIEDAVARNERLVGDLVDVVRSPGSWSLADAGPVDLEDVAHDTVAGLRPTWQGARLRVEVVSEPDHGRTWGDRARLRQVVTNLMTNAIRHARHTIVVRIAGTIETVELEVRDDGPGLLPELVPELFQPFPRHRDRREDTLGIGLAIARRLLELHAGDIRADAGGGDSGRGASFIITLPRLDERLATRSGQSETGATGRP